MTEAKPDGASKPIGVGAVSYLNSKPLIYGLENDPGIALHLRVPSALLDGLADRSYDVALLPVIDFQRMEGLRIIPVGGIACDGPTLTVRIFSKVPIGRIGSLACDLDSHTSVALARVVLDGAHGISPEFLPWDAAKHPGGSAEADATLLIGDKVVCAEPRGYEHQLDLGEAWKALTGLPFVFAVWMARGDAALGDLPARLRRARIEGCAAVESIIPAHAIPRGWPADIARKYLTQCLQYEITPRHIEAMGLFHRKAAALGLIDSPARVLVVEGTG